jgi:hypothetical protein
MTARPERLWLSAIEAPLWRPQPLKGASMPNNDITFRSDEGKPVLTIFFLGLDGVIEYAAPMSAPPPKEPTTSELLQRITRLEEEVAHLQKAQTNTAVALTNLEKDLVSEATNTTKHIKAIYNKYLADIHTELWPLVHKVFPERAKKQDQTAGIIRNGGPWWDGENP